MINTGTSIVTFLIVFLIQSAQNRDTVALQIKFDELIRAIESADISMLIVEELGEDKLTRIGGRYKDFTAQTRKKAGAGLNQANAWRG